MTETIIFLCGVLSGLVALLLGYFIRMGVLHNREIKVLKVDIETAFKMIEETREDIMKEIEIKQNINNEDIEDLHKRVGFAQTQIEESFKYTDKRFDKLTEKISMYLNKNS